MLIVPTLITGGSVTLPPVSLLLTGLLQLSVTESLCPTSCPDDDWVLDHPDLETTDLSTLETVMYGASPVSARLAEGIERMGPVFAQLWPDRMCWHHHR